MRPDTKLRVARRKHTVDLLRWLYSRRDERLDGARLSLAHRHRQEGGVAGSRPLTYGEVDVSDFLAILDTAKPKVGEVFVDLGSGTGKAVLAAACGFPEFSKCRGIELVQGLADAANDHLQTVKACLTGPVPSTSGNDSTTTITNTEAKTAASASASSAGNNFTLSRSAGDTNETRRRSGGKGGKRGSTSKAANQGLSAPDLEALIVDLLKRLSSKEAGCGRHGGSSNDGEGSNRQEATAEDIAACLVRELGHRRYKASLRGYGGLQKFLTTRTETSDTSSRLVIASDGGTVGLTTTETSSPVTDDSPHRRRTVDDQAVGEKLIQGSAFAGQDGCKPLARLAGGDEAESTMDATIDTTVVLPHLEKVALERSSPVQACATLGSPPISTPSNSTSTSSCLYSCGDTVVSREEKFSIPPTPPRLAEGGGCTGGIDKRRLPEGGPLTCESLSGVEFICGDIFQEPWSDAGVVYVASLLFDEDMMARLSKFVQKLQQGARVISLRPLPALGPRGSKSNVELAGSLNGSGSPAIAVLRLLHEGVFRMSWQMARVYIYVRL